MNAYHRQSRARDLDERKAFVKAKARFGDVVTALHLDTDLGDAAPCCGAFALKSCHDGKGWYCEACGDKGSMIGLVMRARDCSLGGAIAFLETCLPGRKDAGTMELFAAPGPRRAAAGDKR